MDYHASKLSLLDDHALLASALALSGRSASLEADLLDTLGEIDARALYAARAHPSMHSYCVRELGFSEDVAFNRITVARCGRRWPAIIEALRARQVHLTGLRLLSSHLTDANHRGLLAEAAGKTKREIEELVARIAPRPPVPTVIRQMPRPTTPPSPVAPPGPPAVPAADVQTAFISARAPRPRPAVVAPLATDAFKVQFTATRAFCDKLRQAKDLMRHRVRDGGVATILEAALDGLIDRAKKERFGVGCKPRPAKAGAKPASSPAEAARSPAAPGASPMEVASPTTSAPSPTASASSPAQPASRPPVPAAMAREVYERDGGRCTYVDDRGHRCTATACLEIDHIDGWARTHRRDVSRLRLLCRTHNKFAAERMYGRAFMERARKERVRRTDVKRVSARLDASDVAHVPAAGSRPGKDAARRPETGQMPLL